MKTNIKLIYDFFKKYPKHKGKVSVKSRFGCYPIKECEITAKNSEVFFVETCSGKKIKGSPDHLLLTKNLKWEKIKNLNLGDILFSEDGVEKINRIGLLPYREDLYDLEVGDVHEFYANGIVSHNSSILEAVYFALTGKAYRKINKGDLINTKNKKDCLVTLCFNIREDCYVVKRGIKPNLFEIYKNNEPLDESSHVRDFQEVLNNLTGINESAIEQIIIISNRFYKPFLELPAAQKRTFIENIFGLHLFSEMNDSLKQRISTIKQKDVLLNKDIERIDSNVKILSETKQEDPEDYHSIIEELEKSNTNIEVEISGLEKKQKELKESRKKLEDILVNKNEIVKKKIKCETELESLDNKIKFYQNNETCPTCKQNIDKAAIQDQLVEFNKEIDLWVERKILVNKKLTKLNEVETKLSGVKQELNSLELSIGKLRQTIINNNQLILNNKRFMLKQNEISVDNTNKILGLKTEKESKLQDILDLTRERKNVTVVQSLISDSGIKKFIFSKYVPILNKHLNDYLEILDSKYRLVFDDEMNEKIVAIGYDKLEYGSFSAGEKQRCDLALLFSFLEIAKMKNNLSCNLLFCDEMFADLDQEGVNGLSNIFGLLKEKGYSVNLITHDDKIKDLGDRSMEARKKVFSGLVEV